MGSQVARCSRRPPCGVAVRTFPRRLPGQCLKSIAVVGGRIGCRFNRRHPEQSAARISTQVSQGFAVPTLDGAGWHRLDDRPVVPENISLLHLPPYSHELNLVDMGIGADSVCSFTPSKNAIAR